MILSKIGWNSTGDNRIFLYNLLGQQGQAFTEAFQFFLHAKKILEGPCFAREI